MQSLMRILRAAFLWSRLINRLIAAEPDAAYPTSEGIFGYRRDLRYYERIATPELADDFYRNCGIT